MQLTCFIIINVVILSSHNLTMLTTTRRAWCALKCKAHGYFSCVNSCVFRFGRAQFADMEAI